MDKMLKGGGGDIYRIKIIVVCTNFSAHDFQKKKTENDNW